MALLKDLGHSVKNFIKNILQENLYRRFAAETTTIT